MYSESEGTNEESLQGPFTPTRPQLPHSLHLCDEREGSNHRDGEEASPEGPNKVLGTEPLWLYLDTVLPE